VKLPPGPTKGSSGHGARRPDSRVPADEGGVEHRLARIASLLAPTTFITGLLFYFGYVTSGAQYRYFGLTQQVLGFSSQDYLLRSIEALYAPLIALFLGAAVIGWGHSLIVAYLTRGAKPRHVRRARRQVQVGALALVILGVLLCSRGVVGIVIPRIAITEAIATTPLSLGSGVLLVAYGRYLAGRFGQPAWLRRMLSPRLDHLLAVVVGALVLLTVFWAVNSYAVAYGQTEGRRLASSLTELPAVVLESKDERSIGYNSLVFEEVPDQPFPFRYSELRLLYASNDKYFLIPEQWSAEDGRVLVVTDDDSIRLQLLATP
jgi:hypothetical protein